MFVALFSRLFLVLSLFEKMPITPEGTPNSEVGNFEHHFFEQCSAPLSPCCKPISWQDDTTAIDINHPLVISSTIPPNMTERVEIHIDGICYYAISCEEGTLCKIVFVPDQSSESDSSSVLFKVEDEENVLMQQSLVKNVIRDVFTPSSAGKLIIWYVNPLIIL